MSEPTKPVSELTDSELEQEFPKAFEARPLEEGEGVTTLMLAMVEVGDE